MARQNNRIFDQVSMFCQEAPALIAAGDKTAVNRLFFILWAGGLKVSQGEDAAFMEAMIQAYVEIVGHPPKMGAMFAQFDVLLGVAEDWHDEDFET